MTMPPKRLVLWAGLLPVLAVNLAYLINVTSGADLCFPYLEGCQSVSRGLRSGPGLWLFKLLALPCAVFMLLAWRETPDAVDRMIPDGRPLSAAVVGLGLISTFFFLVYAVWLGTEGDIYRWLRRYGVVFYFAGAGLAHLLIMFRLWQARRRVGAPCMGLWIRTYCGMVALTWATGVASALKRNLSDDPLFLDRLENALEWNFALCLSLCFLALAPLIRSRGERGA